MEEQKIRYMYFFAPYAVGRVKPERQCDKSFQDQRPDLSPDRPSEDTFYPFQFICPFHFEHPFTSGPTPVNELLRKPINSQWKVRIVDYCYRPSGKSGLDCASQPGVQGVPQTISYHIEGKDHQHQRQSRGKREYR
jgi:hypothetical protein